MPDISLRDIAEFAIESAGEAFGPRYVESATSKEEFFRMIESFELETAINPPKLFEVSADPEYHQIHVVAEFDSLHVFAGSSVLYTILEENEDLILSKGSEGSVRLEMVFPGVWLRR